MNAPSTIGRVVYMHRTRGGGVEGVHIDGIVGGLKARGFEVVMVAPAPSRPVVTGEVVRSPSWLARTAAWLSEHAPEFLFEFAELAYNVVSWRALKRCLRQHPVRLIYERYAIFSLSGALLARRHGVPLVVEVNYTARSPLVRQRTAWLKFLARWVDRKIFERATVLVAVSSTLRTELIRDYGVAPARIVVSPNAADPHKFDPSRVTPIANAEGKALAGKCVIGFVGSFAPWHGVDLLLAAFVVVARTIPESVLLLIGDGPERAKIEAEAARHGLRDRVMFTGPIPHRDLGQYVARFDIAVMPDSNDYGSPMKIFEYMAMGRAVVAPDYAPILDVLRDNENGVVFARRNGARLAERLVDLCKDTSQTARLGAAARKTIVSERSWLHNVDMFLTALDDDSRLGLHKVDALNGNA